MVIPPKSAQKNGVTYVKKAKEQEMWSAKRGRRVDLVSKAHEAARQKKFREKRKAYVQYLESLVGEYRAVFPDYIEKTQPHAGDK